MRKVISAFLLIAFVSALVGSHARPADAKKHYSYSTVSKSVLKVVNAEFLMDAVVPEVQLHSMDHIASVYIVVPGHAPLVRPLIRGPAMHFMKVIGTNRSLWANLC